MNDIVGILSKNKISLSIHFFFQNQIKTKQIKFSFFVFGHNWTKVWSNFACQSIAVALNVLIGPQVQIGSIQ